MARVITGLDNIPISAASAAFAPTNTADVTAMIDSAVSGKLDASASSSFQPVGNYVSSSDLSGYLPTSSIGVDSASAVTSIAGSSVGGGTTYTAGQYIQISGDEISVTGLQPSGDYVSSSELADYQPTSSMSAYQQTADMSAYLPTSAIGVDSASAVTSIDGSSIAGGLVTSTATMVWENGGITATALSSVNDTPIASQYLLTDTQWSTEPTATGKAYSQMNVNPLTTPFTATSDIYSPLQYATGAVLTYMAMLSEASTSVGALGGRQTFGGFFKGNEIFISNGQSNVQQCLRLETHKNRGVHISGTDALNSSYFDLSTAGVGVSSTAGTATFDLAHYNSWNDKLDASSIGTSVDGITGIAGTAIVGGGAGGADWSAESGQPGYIENKPVPKTLVAGSGITITENSAELVVASTNALYSAGNGLTLNGTTFAVDTGVVATQSDLSGYVPGTSPIIGTETFAGYWNGSAVYQKLVSGVITSNAAGTAADSDPDYSGKTAWIDLSNSFMTYGSTGNILPLNWYLGSARNGGFSLVGGARPILYRGVDSSATTCTAYVCVKYIK